MSSQTELQAKTKWCPWRKLEYSKPNSGVANQKLSEEYNVSKSSACIGRDCMAWYEFDYMEPPQGICRRIGND